MPVESSQKRYAATRLVKHGNVLIIDPSLSDDFSTPQTLASLLGRGEVVRSGGRGAARVVEFVGRLFLVRPYRRGGLPGKLIKDTFIYLGERNIRGVKEFRLLCHLREKGLPVPKPILTTYAKRGMTYRCTIVLDYIPEVLPLAEAFPGLKDEDWYELGSLLQEFHGHNVYHADLNAYNILVGRDKFYLIDFDKCYIIPEPLRMLSRWWMRRNIKRLYRSLVKCGLEDAPSPSRGWQALLGGYEGK